MLKGFGNVLVKELKELIRDPKILVGMIVLPLVMLPVLGLVLGYAQETAQQQAQKSAELLLVVDNDGGYWSRQLIGNLSQYTNVAVLNNTSPQQVLSGGLLAEYNRTEFILIPQNFSATIDAHFASNASSTATVDVYSVFQEGGIFSNIGAGGITQLTYSFNRVVAPDVLHTVQSTIIRGEIAQGVDPTQLSSLLYVQSIALPVTIMILLTYSMQIAATSVAQEKEEKTLETLLTVPVDRFAILMGKLSSTIIVAGAAAIAILFGYNFMFSSLTGAIQSTTSIDLVKLGLVPSPLGYLLLGISLFVTLLSALALAVIMSAFSEDVRGAQALVGYLYPVIYIPALALIYVDINTLPDVIKAVFYAIPYSHPIIASSAVVLGDYNIVILGILYVTAFTLVIMYIASKLFSTEKILTAKLRFGKNKRKTEPQE
ncbi:MAG: ABC transporter permease [Candidatus Bathyarchaeota archaeon]|nr:ABC transporter permease [Candidatus Bathyarchaeota archaeon]